MKKKVDKKPKKETLKPYHHGNLKPDLIAAGLELLVKKGPEALSLREVARKAGVSHAAPYRHFSDKEALIAAIAEEGFHRLQAQLVQGGAGSTTESGDALMRIDGLIVCYVKFAAENPELMKLMFSSWIKSYEAHDGLFEAASGAFNEVLSTIHRAHEQKSLRFKDDRTMAIGAWSMVHGLSMLMIEGRIGLAKLKEKELETLARNMAQIYREGVRG